jgi:hypothetical protein
MGQASRLPGGRVENIRFRHDCSMTFELTPVNAGT